MSSYAVASRILNAQKRNFFFFLFVVYFLVLHVAKERIKFNWSVLTQQKLARRMEQQRVYICEALNFFLNFFSATSLMFYYIFISPESASSIKCVNKLSTVNKNEMCYTLKLIPTTAPHHHANQVRLEFKI